MKNSVLLWFICFCSQCFIIFEILSKKALFLVFDVLESKHVFENKII